MSKNSVTVLLLNYDKQQLEKLSRISPPAGMLEINIIYDIEPSTIIDMELNLCQTRDKVIKQLKAISESPKVTLICGNKAYITCHDWANKQLPACPASVKLSRLNKLSFNV